MSASFSRTAAAELSDVPQINDEWLTDSARGDVISVRTTPLSWRSGAFELARLRPGCILRLANDHRKPLANSPDTGTARPKPLVTERVHLYQRAGLRKTPTALTGGKPAASRGQGSPFSSRGDYAVGSMWPAYSARDGNDCFSIFLSPGTAIHQRDVKLITIRSYVHIDATRFAFAIHCIWIYDQYSLGYQVFGFIKSLCINLPHNGEALEERNDSSNHHQLNSRPTARMNVVIANPW